jgi:RNA polymerase sigma factor (TIGR02999 family)
MSDEPSRNLTRVLNLAGQGDPRASAELLPLLYRELRRLAGALMAKTPPGNTLQPTALVHEAYLRLVGPVDGEWNSRGHFFSAAAQAMRQILVDQARRKGARKHGGGLRKVELDEAGEADLRIESPVADVLALDGALSRLERDAPRKAEVVKLRYFAGLSVEETAAALGVSVPTVERDWRFARAVLLADLGEGEAAL